MRDEKVELNCTYITTSGGYYECMGKGITGRYALLGYGFGALEPDIGGACMIVPGGHCEHLMHMDF
jgi:hypothetical protein